MPKTESVEYTVYCGDVKVGWAPTYKDAYSIVSVNKMEDWAIFRRETIEQLVSSSQMESNQ